jgi:L-seryl-tRNA(Ser) seleniumtransferase
MSDPRRSIPSVERLLTSEAFAALLQRWDRAVVTDVLRGELAALRASPNGAPIETDAESLAARVSSAVERLAAGSIVRVINATGVILHTNLGRAPLAESAILSLQAAAGGYSNLEYDTASGSRGSRYTHCRALLQHLTGAEDALVVNNNAAALVLALNTLARGLDAVVSRGELVEIGGAFRIPEIMARSGARLHEVGATNRTHLDDYRAALSPATGVLLKVHPSNFTIEGYTAEVPVQDLVPVAREGSVPLLHDIGGGLLLDPTELNLPPDEPMARHSLACGADVVTMSGDKLLGGPQCGILVGTAAYIDRMRRNPLCRALRVDKLTVAALEATLRLYLDRGEAKREIPVLRMLTMNPDALERRATALAATCSTFGYVSSVRAGESAVGGGAAPSSRLPTTLIVLRHPEMSGSELERRLRGGSPCVAVRMLDGDVAIDPRTVLPADEVALLTALRMIAE